MIPRALFLWNISLGVLLLLKWDPFAFFPSSYTDAKALYSFPLSEVEKLEISQENLSVQIWKENGFWRTRASESGKELMLGYSDFSSIEALHSQTLFLRKFRKWSSDPREIENLPQNLWISVDWTTRERKKISFQIHNCIEKVSDCLVLFPEDKNIYLVPGGIRGFFSIPENSYFMTLSPFRMFPRDTVQSFAWKNKNQIRLFLQKEGNKWFRSPDFGISSELDPSRVQEFWNRWADETGKIYIPTSKESLSPTGNQIFLTIVTESANSETLVWTEYASSSMGSTLLKLEPKGPWLLFSKTFWDYWNRFDPRALDKDIY